MNDTRTPAPISGQTFAAHTQKAMTVAELNRQVKRLLEVSYAQIWVTGELSGFSRPSSGHWYFNLKDQRAQIRCAMFRGFNQRLKYQPKEGDQVIVRGKVSLYEGRGDFQLIVEDIEPAGLGALQAAFEALKLKLSQEGLFDPKHKKPIPRFINRLAVITSPTGAVIHDVIHVCAKRFPALPILLVPVKVQGEGAAEEIAQAIETVNSHGLADAIIVGRGGGSLEDLWAFNEERVARAIHASALPIISAVGHEVDFTIADLVSDLRAPTPSAAAESITPDQFELMQLLDHQHRRLVRQTLSFLKQHNEGLVNLGKRLKSPQQSLLEKQHRIREFGQRLKSTLRHQIRHAQQALQSAQLALANWTPQTQLRQRKEHTDQLEKRLQQAQLQMIQQHQHRLQLAAQTLHTASPLATLGRGYAIAFDDQKHIVKSPTQVQSGDALTIKVEQGDIACRVE